MSSIENHTKKLYKLVGADGKPYFSEQKGTLGGHRKLKIYGRLDCPSALRHIARGCMHERNRRLVDNSAVCVCYLTQPAGGTHYTVEYARRQGLSIINLGSP